MSASIRLLTALLLPLPIGEAGLTLSTAPIADEGEELFVREVKPLLEATCFSCHGPHAERLRGGLMMSGHESLLTGGTSGPAIVPGDPDGSLLMELVRERDPEYSMPPKHPLAAEEVAIFERWIELGAPWPGGEAVIGEPREIDLDEGRGWWSFRPVRAPEAPDLESAALEQRATGELDRFVFARLEAAGLTPARQASDLQLVRRVHQDLLGLPPTPEEVRAYLSDSRTDRWGRLVDSLLERPEYAERQARAWLDVVRFAQTNGYERDTEKPMAWRYRDYVVSAFETDKPYDRFLQEQLAGDELEDGGAEALVATGFYRLGAWDSEPDDRDQADLDVQDDVLRTIGEGMLGLTIGCARCHDHRTDPLRQQDYYSLLAFVRGVTPYRKAKFALDSPLLRPLDPTPERLARHERERARGQLAARERAGEFAAELLSRYGEERSLPVEAAARLKLAAEKELQDQLSDDERLQLYLLKLEAEELEGSFEGSMPWALVASESGPQVEPTFVLRRGRAGAPMQEVRPAFPPVLCATDADAEPDDLQPRERSSGRRSSLARWITDPANPLTARVMVNRIWKGHFGRGLVATPDDFGRTGELPTHPELLDWLAEEFVRGGWSVKAMHRLILRSATYRMASSDDASGASVDPSNHLLWRQNPRRLDAEAVRDGALFVAGRLATERGGRGFFPDLSRDALAGSSKPGHGWEPSRLEDCDRRALYTFAKRGQLDPLLEVFDLANPTMPQGRRSQTTVASQALAMLNDELIVSCAEDLARRVRREWPFDERAQLERLFHLAFSRAPVRAERELVSELLDSQTEAFAALPERLILAGEKPDRLELDYLAALAPQQFFSGPAEGWTYLRGLWGLRYNQTEQYDRLRGPAALLDAPTLADGEVRARLRVAEGTPFVGWLLRSSQHGTGFVGLQALMDLEAGELLLLQHGAAEAEPLVLARGPLELEPGREYDLTLRMSDSALEVELDGSSQLTCRGITRVVAGQVGLRTWGDGVELSMLSVGGEPVPMPQRGTPRERALTAVALVLLNSNEFHYID
jgi:hypothetical protein